MRLELGERGRRRSHRVGVERHEGSLELLHGGVALFFDLRKAAPHHRLELRRDRGVQGARRGQLFGEQHDERARGIVGVEGPCASEQVVEDRADRVDVGALVDDLGARLLGGHEARRSEDDARLGEVDVVILDAADAEVDHLDARHAGLPRLLLQQEDVLRLHVAVNDTFCVRGGEGAANLARDADGERHTEPPHLLDERTELFPVEELRRDAGRAVARVEDVDHLDDVGVGDAARALRLALEPLDDFRVLRELGQEDLDRESSLLQAKMARLVDLAHAALPDEAHDLVALVQHLTEERVGGRREGPLRHERHRVVRAEEHLGRVASSTRGAHLRQAAERRRRRRRRRRGRR